MFIIRSLYLYAFECFHYSHIEIHILWNRNCGHICRLSFIYWQITKFIRYEYRAAWLIHKIWMLGYMIDSWDMNVAMHDYLIIICFYKIRLCFITIYIPGLGIVLSIYIVVPIFIGILSISWVQILRDDINTDIRLM